MMKDCLNEALYHTKRSAIRKFSNLAANTPGCISLTLGEPDFDTPDCIEKQVQKAFEAHETHYIPNNGMLSLRKKIASYENQKGHHYTEDNVIVTAGAEEGLFLSLFSILNPGDEVIVPLPAFGAYEEIIHLCRGKFIPLDTAEDDFQINEEKLKALINEHTKAIILNTPNNPTGVILNEESLSIVHDAVKDKPIFVLADDVYQQLVYTDNCHSITEYEDLQAQMILIQSFSKPYAMTGWRMGYVCLDPDIRERVELVHQYMITSTPAPFQRAAMAALDYDPSDMRNTYAKRRAFMLKRLEEIGLQTVRPDGAFYVFPSIKKYGMTSEEFCTRMIQEVKLAATPGSAFGAEGFIRLTYCYSDEVLEEGMNRLEKFVNRLTVNQND